MRLRYWVCLLVSPLAFGADESSLSLEAAIEAALQRAPQVLGATAGVEAAQSLADSAGRLPDPSLVVGIDNLPVTGSEAYSTTRDFMTMRKVGVMQDFPRAGKRRLQHQRAEADADRAGAELAMTRLDVARQTAQAWIRLATANASLQDLRTLQPELDLGASAARAAVAAGRSSGAEALSAEAAAARLKTRILQMQSEQRRARADLARWIGEDADRPLASMPSLDVLPAPVDVILNTPHLHGEILPFEARIAAARADVDLARADRRPDWSSELSFAKRGPDFSDMVSLQFTIGLPLFTKHRQDPVIAARRAELRQLEAQRETEIRMHTAETQQRVIDWQQLGEQLAQYDDELVPLARERTHVALASYRAGNSELRLALDAFEDEIGILIDRAALENERGRAWTYLRYLQPQHLHP
jgi:cobalt-zinc-cadmium efflux system outer membrane protein